MIRYVLSLPGNVSPEVIHKMREAISDAADDHAFRDVVLAFGATLKDYRPQQPARPGHRAARSESRTVSRINARPAHAAGDSWRKWEDPITYARPWGPDLFLWAMCALVGVLSGLVVS